MKDKQKTAVMYGAGNIGRGFIAQVFSDSGFEVVFIDIDPAVVSALNSSNTYTQLVIDGDDTERREVTGVRAVDGNNTEAVAAEIAGCDIMAVSVGTAALPHIAPFIADGLARRKNPLNILICENLKHAPAVLRGYVSEYLPDSSKAEQIGFIGATIGRMVPVMQPQQRLDDITLIAVEKYCLLPIDGDAVIPPMPELQYTILCSPFSFEEDKKLYIHNMGHALAAYFGALKEFTFIWQAMDDNGIRKLVHEAMSATAEALARKYDEDLDKLTDYVNDLITRFGNKGLGDTVARVGGDPLRKLAPEDRLAGAVCLCRELGVDYSAILSGIAAALRFDIPGDPSAKLLHKQVSKNGAAVFLQEYCGLSGADANRCVSLPLGR